MFPWIRVAFLLAVALTTGGAAWAQVLLDNFNRADGAVGTGWTVQAGSITIQGNTARGTDMSLMTFNGQTGNTISADIYHNGSGTQYGALVLGYAGVSTNLFVKVQDNGSGSNFDSVFFYYGNNGSGFGSGQTMFSTPLFSSGRMSLSLIGTVATLTVDTNFDGIPDLTFTRNDVPISSLGSAIGLGFYGQAAFDNFTLGVVPEPGVTALLCCGLGVLLVRGRRLRRKPPHDAKDATS